MFNQRFNPSYPTYNDPTMDMMNNYTQRGYNPSYNPNALMNPFDTASNNFASVPNPLNSPSYAKGGNVSLPKWARKLQAQGRNGDSMLAHINPIEAAMLKKMGGSGTTNPKTGLKEYGFFKNPLKALKGSVGGIGGAIVGNMLLPGLGGILGGALGGAAGSAARGRKDYGSAALRGGLTGAILPTAAGWLGAGANQLGAPAAGEYLTNYGNTNAILPSLGLGGMSGVAGGGQGAAPMANMGAGALANAGVPAVPQSFSEMLLSKGKDFLSDPKNLLSTAALAATALNRPKEKSPEKIADEQKRLERALRNMSPEERAEKEAQLLAEEQMKRRIQRNKFLPEERLERQAPLYIRSNSPEEYRRQGKWLNYYDNPEFTGEAQVYKQGGEIRGGANKLFNPFKQTFDPTHTRLIEGDGGGQDDNIETELPQNSYIVNASTTSDLGDGSPAEGAKKVHAFISKDEMYISPEDVKKVGKGDVQKGVKALDKLAKKVSKHKRGGVALPPKAKTISQYLKK